MKKIYTMLMTAVMMLAFTSCQDQEIARTLEGTWRGNMYISTYYSGYTYNATATEITFLKDPLRYASGTGMWIDYYSNAPWDYVANHITWSVTAGTITVRFQEEGTQLEIWDYSLSDNRFCGTINDHGQRVDFELYYTSRPYDYYDSYRWGYDSWYGYYSRTRGDVGTDSTESAEKPRRFVNPDNKQ